MIKKETEQLLSFTKEKIIGAIYEAAAAMRGKIKILAET